MATKKIKENKGQIRQNKAQITNTAKYGEIKAKKEAKAASTATSQSCRQISRQPCKRGKANLLLADAFRAAWMKHMTATQTARVDMFHDKSATGGPCY